MGHDLSEYSVAGCDDDLIESDVDILVEHIEQCEIGTVAT